MGEIIGLISVVCLFVVLPGIIFGFRYLGKKKAAELELGRQRKEILELEVRKEELHLQALLEEGRKYDRIIDSRSGQGQGEG